jgi:UDP-glucuronate decarboxylase
MRIWVTGARGFIGRHVVAQAALAGHEVWALARPGASRPGDLPPGAHLVALDLADGQEVTSRVKSLAPEVIVHLAWYARPQDYVTSLDNVDSLATTLSFAKAALLAGCRNLVGVGTCLEYADAPGPRHENDLLDPKSLYARCKRAAHLVLGELFDRQGARLVWARLFHMHGPGENPARLLPAVIAALRAGQAFSLSPGEQMRDHLDVRDVARALVHLAGSDLKGAVNVCSGRPVTLRAVLEVVGRELERPELLHFGERPYLSGEVMNLTGIPARLFESGFRPAHADLAASIRETIAATGTTI